MTTPIALLANPSAADGRSLKCLDIVRATLEICALAVGIVLGGTFGVGTVLFALLVGPIVEGSFAVLALTPLAVPSPEPVPVVIGE